jgi:hypothetical protein
MNCFLLKFKTKNLKLYAERSKELFERPKKYYFCDGGIETLGVDFTIFHLYIYLHSERYYKTWLD